MALSARASVLLASFPRYPYVGSARTMEYVFAKAGLPIYEPVIEFQRQYAGYEIIVMHYRLFPRLRCGVLHHKPLPPSRNPLVKLRRLARRTVSHRYGEYRVENYHFRVTRHRDKWLFGCTDDWFEGINYIDEEGRLYHLMGISGSEPHLYAFSMDKCMEKEAFVSTVIVADKTMKHLCWVNKRDVDWEELSVKWRLVKDEDASDELEQFWYSESLVTEVRASSINFWNTPLLDEPRKQWLLRLSESYR